MTRVAVYISLISLYCLGGNKVKAGELSVGAMASFIGYTFILTFSVRKLSCDLLFISSYLLIFT
ncbi:ABC transporter B family member [Arachis hypogaea]|nr:ABC transporter B family member [Arachis hypogaea]